jgi:hypothetical protein
VVVKIEVLDYKTTAVVRVGRFLTQELIRPQKLNSLFHHEAHEASFTTLSGNEVSNAMLTDIHTKRSDAFFKFVVAARADCLPTPANIGRWFPSRPAGPCRRCETGGVPTQARILNRCTANYQLMTQRHNRLAAVVRRAIERNMSRKLRSEIRGNTTMEEEGLSEETRNLRSDMAFERQEGSRQVIEVIEFSCPYGCVTREGATLKHAFE